MISKVLQGIPFLVDASSKKIYAFEKPVSANPLCLGTYDPEKETFQLYDNWKELYESKLQEYRQTVKPFSRIQQATR